MKKVFKTILFLAIGIVIFLGVQDVLTPDNMSGGTPEKAVNGFLALDKDSVDVLILGASHPEFGISPMQLYEETGIVSYNLGTGGQPIEASYYALKEAFKTQTPKAVLLVPSSILHNVQLNSSWRFVLDKLPLDDVKLEMAADYGSREFGDGYWSAFFPIIKYHSRWKELTKKDFEPHWEGMYYSAGGLLVSKVSPTGTTMGDINATEEMMRDRSQGYITKFDGQTSKTQDVQGELFRPQINEERWDYLLKIRDLCHDHGSELILVTMPTLQLPWAAGGWTEEKSALMKEYAASEGITYIDLACDYDLVDYTTDSFDAGMHLNCRGAEKVTRFLGEYLQTKITPSGNNSLYDEMSHRYDKAFDVAMLESEKDFYTYIERLTQRLDNSTVFIAVNNEYTRGMTEEDYEFLREKLGLELVQDGTYTDSYVAVINRGELLYEALSNREIKYSKKIDNLSVSLRSSGWLSRPASSIKINGSEYVNGGRGLNIVVYDNESGVVIDSVSFDTFQKSKPASRNWTAVDGYLRAYESAVCFD